MSQFYSLEFEKPLADLERRIKDAEQQLGSAPDPSAQPQDLAALRAEHQTMLEDIYSRLSPWDTVRVARHPARPQTRDYIALICRDFVELHGDRRFGDDPALVAGFGRIGAHKCMVIGHQKGKETAEKLACHFGCAHPEGYRKALAKMKLAAKFKVPIVTFVDTPGAYPGLGAEQRGQAEAIAVNLLEMSRLPVPIVSIVIGEGGSGGALGIAVADRVAMLQHSWYSVISPEGCAAILWKQANEQTNSAAAKALRLTASDNIAMGIIEDVIPEPAGGAHRAKEVVARRVERWVSDTLDSLRVLAPEVLMEGRYQRFRKMGAVQELPAAPAVSS